MSAPTVLVVGQGPSALEAAKEVVAQGGRAVFAQPSAGRACALRVPGGIETLLGARLVRLDGSVGGFTARLAQGGDELTVEVGSVVLVPGPSTPGEQHGGHTRLEDALAGLPKDVKSVAVVLGPSATRPDHLASLDLAVRLRSRTNPPEVTLFCAEVLVKGAEELRYAEAQRMGARVVRTEGAPTICGGTVKAIDRPSGLPVELAAEVVVAEGTSEVGPLPEEDGILAGVGNVSMGPASSTREGVLMCLSAGRELCGGDLLAEARAAATRAVTLARHPPARAASSARVDRDKCSACLTCVRSCPFRAPRIDEEGKASVEGELCQACGICVAACPSRALSLPSDLSWKETMSSLFKVKP